MTEQEQYDAIVAYYKHLRSMLITIPNKEITSYFQHEKIINKFSDDVDVFNEYHQKSSIQSMIWGNLTLEELIEVNKFKDQHPEYFI